MFDLIATVLTGGATGIIGSVIGKVFSFVDVWAENKKADAEHKRTIEMLELQSRLGAEESERELAVAESAAAADIRTASYKHDSSVGMGSIWVVDVLRMVRPILTFTLIVLVGIIYFKSGEVDKSTINLSVLYMCSSAVLWWFGDRSLRPKAPKK